ncbi:hypothetical protein [Clostridium sp. AM27-31LB]|nr:hypothetical protein [Clostridium sp. AM27-31LB]
MRRKYINYYQRTIYAIYYRSTKTIYYNLAFAGDTKLIIFK